MPTSNRVRRSRRAARTLAAALAVGTLAGALPAQAGPRDFLIYAPGQGGSADEARPYVQKLFRFLEKQLGWPESSMNGEYTDDPKAALDYIEKNKPGFGLLAPGLYFQLACKKTPLTPIVTIGSRDVTGAGKYHVVVKKGEGAPKTLEALKGKKLASNHLGDPRFVSRLIFDGKFDVEKHFTLVKSGSPMKPFKLVDRGEADAALIDDNQWTGAQPRAGQPEPAIGQNLTIIYTSPTMPPYPVVAFDKVAVDKDVKAMKQALILLCTTPEGIQVCKESRLDNPTGANPNDFKAGTEKYCK